MELDGSSLGDHEDVRYRNHGQEQILESLSEQLDAPLIDVHGNHHVFRARSIHRMGDSNSGRGTDSGFLLSELKRESVRPSQLTEALSRIQQKILALEKQIRAVSNTTSHADKAPRSAIATFPIEEENTHVIPRHTSMIAKIREASWTDFMQRFEDDENDYAIDVLVGEPEHHQTSERHNSGKRNMASRPSVGTEAGIASMKPHPFLKAPPSIPERIRINSPYILDLLAKYDENIDASAPVVMLGPYKLLKHCEDKIRKTSYAQQHKSPPADVTSETQQILDPASHQHDVTRTEHLQCLVKFMDQYVKPVTDRLRYNNSETIYFRDLWYIFFPGEDIFMPLKDRQQRINSDPTRIAPEMLQGRYERTWRVIGTGGGRTNVSSTVGRGVRTKQNAFQINCYHIDFDGRYFCPVVHQFTIQPFLGERDIKSLDFYPLRYAELSPDFQNHSKLIFDALQRSHTHFYYRGPTLTTHPCGCPIQGGDLHQEHVESEVIVDYRTTLLKHPSWRPQTSFWRDPPSKDNEVSGEHRVYQYRDRTKSQLIGTEIDQIYDDNKIDREIALVCKDEARIFDPVPSGWVSNETSISDREVILISTRVFGFVLRTRSFAPLWMWGLSKISAQTDGLRNLQLRDNNFKDTLHALVRTHLLQTNGHEHPGMEPDITRAKGQGLVLLLHGAPGVGKTFTAESIAAANGRPLFQITCGDLGLTPFDVERALKEIFQHAQLWNCVLLLDECDIFLTQRTKADLKRNSLVSVFLRVLEWYSGVLFLTTNRVGALDSAVRSRITWSAYYPRLNQSQTREIWRASLDLLEKRHVGVEVDKKSIMKFAKEHFEATNSNGSSWNGRQIQNAFKVAVSLADWDTMTGEEQHATTTGIPIKRTPRRLKLTASHFNIVAEAAEMFDEYLLQTTGLTEAQRAWNAQERADDYQDDEATPENSGSTQALESLSKRRRTWSVTSNMQAQSYEGNSVQFQPASSSKRRQSSSQQVKPTVSRRTSQQQQPPMLKRHRSWAKSGVVTKNTQESSPIAAAVTHVSLSPTKPQGSLFSNKRKRKRDTTDVNGRTKSSKVGNEPDSSTESSNEQPYPTDNPPDMDENEQVTNNSNEADDSDWA